jgi:ankyrin repeat protein
MSDSNVSVGLWDQENSLGPLVRTEFPNGYYKDLIEFWRLVQVGTADDVQTEIARGRDVNALDAISGVTSLMVAAACSSPEVVRCLIGAGALVNVRSKLVGISDLFRYIKEDHNRVIDIYERRNREQDLMRAMKGLHGWTSLELALDRGKCPEIIEALLAWGADANSPDRKGISPLRNAIGNQDIRAIKGLLNRGARVNDQDEHGETPLMEAVQINDNLETIQLLLEAGASVDARDLWGATALTWAARSSTDEEVLVALARAGATVEFKDALGYTPLLYAATMQNREVVATLIDHGANVGARTPEGLTALMLVARNDVSGYRSAASLCVYFITKGVDINAQDNQGMTALMHAICSPCVSLDLLNVLLDAYPDLSIKDANGRTARDYLKANRRIKRKDPVWRIYKATT